MLLIVGGAGTRAAELHLVLIRLHRVRRAVSTSVVGGAAPPLGVMPAVGQLVVGGTIHLGARPKIWQMVVRVAVLLGVRPVVGPIPCAVALARLVANPVLVVVMGLDVTMLAYMLGCWAVTCPLGPSLIRHPTWTVERGGLFVVVRRGGRAGGAAAPTPARSVSRPLHAHQRAFS